MNMRMGWAALVVASILSSCAERVDVIATVSQDKGPPADTRVPPDASMPDASLPDADAGERCVFGPPSKLVGPVNSSSDDWDPHLSGDELRIYFSSWRAGGAGGGDLWVAERGQLSDPFSAPTPIAELNSPELDSQPCLTLDEQTIVFSSRRPGGKGSNDLWIASRENRSAPWSAPRNLAEVSSVVTDQGCHLTDDGLQLYFTSARSGGAGGRDIYRASRSDPGASFSVPVEVDVSSSHDDLGPFLSVDGRELYFSSDRPGGVGGLDIWVAARPEATGELGAAVAVDLLNTPNDDVEPWLSRDGLRIYFNRDARVAGSKTLKAHIWVATRPCRP